MDKGKYLQMAYEACFIYKYFNVQSKSCPLERHIQDAVNRILVFFGLSDKSIDGFLIENRCGEYEKSAGYILEKLKNRPAPFFESLDLASLYIYHAANYEISFDYGVNLSKDINFESQIIADIGGSSGGLAGGINSVYGGASFTVYDTPQALTAGKDIVNSKADQINVTYIEADFLKSNIKGLNADYYILSNVLHDWDDKDAKTILYNVLTGHLPKKALIIYEDIVYGRPVNMPEAVVYGLRLTANVLGARQRTEMKLMALTREVNQGAELKKLLRYGVHSAMVIEFPSIVL